MASSYPTEFNIIIIFLHTYEHDCMFQEINSFTASTTHSIEGESSEHLLFLWKEGKKKETVTL